MSSTLVTRLAVPGDIPALKRLMARSIDGLLPDFLEPVQVIASREVMGLDTQLIGDATYYVVEIDGAPVDLALHTAGNVARVSVGDDPAAR